MKWNHLNIVRDAREPRKCRVKPVMAKDMMELRPNADCVITERKIVSAFYRHNII
jgi:hypothetical protein